MLVSGCSDFSCGLCRLVNRVRPSVEMVEGSRVAIRRVETLGPSHIVLSPKPKEPRSTNIVVTITGRLKGRVPVLNIYLKRRTVYTTCNTAIACTGRLVRKGRSSTSFSAKDLLFGNYPGGTGMTHCRSLTTSTSAVPSYLGVATAASSNRVVTIRRGRCPVCKIRFRPRSVVAPSKGRVLDGFVGTWLVVTTFGRFVC